VIVRKLNIQECLSIDRQIVAPLTFDIRGRLTDFCRTNKGLAFTLFSLFFKDKRVDGSGKTVLSKDEWFSGAFLVMDIQQHPKHYQGILFL
jgi:hypothetical protein